MGDKRGRGRPRKYPQVMYEDGEASGYLREFDHYEADPLRGIGQPDIWSLRQQQNVILAQRAEDHFRNLHAQGEPFDAQAYPDRAQALEAVAIGEWFPAQRVLTEIGRLLDAGREDAALDALAWYWRYSGTRAEDAARFIREWRLGKRAELPD